MRTARRVFLSLVVASSLLGALSLAVIVSHGTHAAAASAGGCIETNFYRDGGATRMTAKLYNPSGTVSGEVDATGCTVGVFYDTGARGTINGAVIHGARYFGVVNRGANVTVKNSNIYNIGEMPFDGTQHGVGIYWVYNSGATGSITGNHVWNYQKGGIVVNGVGSSAQVQDNLINGLGAVNFIAQNGIQIGFGASASVMRNTITGNSYTGGDVSGGIVIVGGPGYDAYFPPPNAYTTNVQIVGNTVMNNDVGVYLTNLAAGFAAPTVPTNIKVVNNTISSDVVTNGYVYQAGISDVGDGDKLINNTISGVGYTPVAGDVPYLRFIDADPTFTNNAKIHANTLG